MNPRHFGAPMRTTAMCAVVLFVAGVGLGVAQSSQGAAMPLEPARKSGASVTPAFEGWYQNPDGSYSLLIGYYNRNTAETLEIPAGPNNMIEPGELDQGQPTHFQTGRQWGVFVIKVPKDFGGTNVRWTIEANGERNSVPFTLNKGYPVTPFKEAGMSNSPPSLTFAGNGPKVTGPPVGIAAELTGKAGEAIALAVSVEDDKGIAPGKSANVATVSFHKYRGPGGVKFDNTRVSAKQQGERISVKASFDKAGEYIVRVQANDESGEGGGGFQCCWTNAYVKVHVQ
ncbi:MAG: hypothetical protein H0T71_14325 [Acidobacteria bacterium]|nr:hypothetical protein [Acidobacteriota bacterium]